MRHRLVVFPLLTLVFVSCVHFPLAAEKYALLVGINEYKDSKIKDLHGCENDVSLIRGVLTGSFGFKKENIRTLLSKEATRDAILGEFRDFLIAKSKPGDSIIFSFSGHGTQIPDISGDEEDGRDEVLMPTDATLTMAGPFVYDDDLRDLLADLDGRLTLVLLDCCHSGTATRGLADGRRGDRRLNSTSSVRGLTFPGMERSSDTRISSVAPGASVPGGWQEVNSDAQSDHVLIAAAQANQSAIDGTFFLPSGRPHRRGAFTNYFVEGLQGPADLDKSGKITLEELYKYTRDELKRHNFKQVPYFEGPGSLRKVTFFGDQEVPAGAVSVSSVSEPEPERINNAPVANAGPDQTKKLGSTVVFDASASHDVDGDPLEYTWAITYKPNESKAKLAVPTSITPQLTVDAPGEYVLQLVVNDGKTSSTPDSVSVSTLNSPPVAQAGRDQTKAVGDIAMLDGGDSYDVDGDSLSYVWTLASRPAGSGAYLDNPKSVYPVFSIDKAGDYVLSLSVSDRKTESEPDSIVVSTKNSPPDAKAGEDQSKRVGAFVKLDGGGSSDVDGDRLAYEWHMVSKPAGSNSSLSDAKRVSPHFTIDKYGDYVVQLVVGDGKAFSPPDTVTISTLNSPPVADAGAPQSRYIAATVQLDGGKSKDADGDSLEYAWSIISKPEGSKTQLNNASIETPVFKIDMPGVYVAQLAVSDGELSSEPDTVTITTLNSQPVADAGPDQRELEGGKTGLYGSRSFDPDGDQLVFKWSITLKPEGSKAKLNKPNAESPTISLDKQGDYVVQLVVNDGTTDSDPDTVTIATEARPEVIPPEGVQVTLPIGSFAGVSVGSLYALFPPNGQADRPAGIMEIASVDEEQSVGVVVSGSAVDNFVAQCVFRPPSRRNLKVSIETVKGERKIRREIEKTLRDMDIVELAEDSEADRRVIVEEDASITILNPWGDTVRGGITANSVEELTSLIARQLTMTYFARQISEMKHPNPPFRVELDVPSDQAILKLGDTVNYEVRCSSNARILLLAIDSAGDVTVLFPNAYSESNVIMAGQTLSIPAKDDGFEIVAAEPTGEVVTKVFAFATKDMLPNLMGQAKGAENNTIEGRQAVEKFTNDLRETLYRPDTEFRWAEASVTQEYKK